METINRTAVTITFKEKFMDWLNQLPDRGDLVFTMDMLNESKPIYLIPNHEDDDKDQRWFNRRKVEFLEEAFESYCTEPKWWPEIRSAKTFDQYLSVEFHCMVWDVVDNEPLERDVY